MPFFADLERQKTGGNSCRCPMRCFFLNFDLRDSYPFPVYATTGFGGHFSLKFSLPYLGHVLNSSLKTCPSSTHNQAIDVIPVYDFFLFRAIISYCKGRLPVYPMTSQIVPCVFVV